MSKKKGSGLGKFALGALVGAGIGILFAPKKGSETRQDLKRLMDDMISNVRIRYSTTIPKNLMSIRLQPWKE